MKTFLLSLAGVLPFLSIVSSQGLPDPAALAQMGIEWETSQHASPNSNFYTVPQNFSRDLAPGTLLAVEQATNLSSYLVPSSLTLSRIMYTTTNLNGTIQPASAYVLWPYAPAPWFASSSNSSSSPSFPLVAWAHGTSGLFATCAPSNYKALMYHYFVPFALAKQGIAVVAPDYAGLGVSRTPDGTHIPHEYSASPAQANDLANAVIAARAAFPSYLPSTGPFAVVGHSQGGGVAWGYAQRQLEHPLPGYRGTVAFAPGVQVVEMITKAWNGGVGPIQTDTLLGVQRLISAGITAVYPSFNFTGVTPVGYERWNILAKVQGCMPTSGLAFAGLENHDTVTPDFTNDSTTLEFAQRTKVGGKPFKGPLLVLAAENDVSLQPEVLESIVDETCEVLEAGNSTESLEYALYEGVNHFPLISASQAEWMDWLKERLSGEAGSKKKRDCDAPKARCTKRRVKGFRTDVSVQFPLPNFLVTEAEAVWQYGL
ncbi:putative secretory lipase [Favolaschia claudopus]|uniref:triacylglycerol lipase n=1 Tax=Favolaschia claudopus TaxID=2862362 RepID=A0AAW0D9Z7_9AGAR